MARLSCWCVALLLAMPARAELALVNTPSGSARIEGDRTDGGQKLIIGDQVILQDDSMSFLWIEAEMGSLLLLGIASGGTACPAEWAWVHTQPGDLRVGETFGTCSDIIELSSDSETVTVSMPSMDADEGRVDFVYDGRVVERRIRGQQASGAPPSSEPAAWIGRLAGEMFTARDWRRPLVALMGEAAYAEAQEVIVIGSPMEVDRGWIAGGGCRPHACDVEVGALAMNLSDGRLLVALDGPDAPPRLWGQSNGHLPAPVAEVMSMR